MIKLISINIQRFNDELIKVNKHQGRHHFSGNQFHILL